MSKTEVIGRKKEKLILKQVLKSRKAEFLALYGRRRVGKTFLIKNFFEKENCIFFYCTGIKDGKLLTQIEEFAKHIGDTFYNGLAILPRKRWKDALEDLNVAISRTPSHKKIILFFDELPWMASPKSGLLQAIDYYWNRYWTHDDRLRLVVCGSSASWIIRKIINDKGGLYNRVTRVINLDPFSLKESSQFLFSSAIKLDNRQVLELYMILGGVPYYLSLIKKGCSATQCIDDLCFKKGGELVDEFNRLFSSLFKDKQIYINLVSIIAKYPLGIGQSALIKESGASDGGRIKQRLKDLEDAGFIMKFVPYGHQEKGIYYKVIDEFTLFYLRWMKPNFKMIIKQSKTSGYWLSNTKKPSWKAWSGLAYEAICYKHISQVRKALNIDAGAAISSWRYAAKKKGGQGAQIDLLFDRDDGVTTICEIKYNEKPFVIDKEYAQKLLNKVAVYKQHSKTNKQIFLAMVTANGLKPTMYSEELISGVVTLDDLFK